MIMTERNFTAQWLWRHPGPGRDLTGRHRRETKSKRQKSDLSWRSVIPPKTHMAESWRTEEWRWRGGGEPPSEPPWDTKCQVSLAERFEREVCWK